MFLCSDLCFQKSFGHSLPTYLDLFHVGDCLSDLLLPIKIFVLLSFDTDMWVVNDE